MKIKIIVFILALATPISTLAGTFNTNGAVDAALAIRLTAENTLRAARCADLQAMRVQAAGQPQLPAVTCADLGSAPITVTQLHATLLLGLLSRELKDVEDAVIAAETKAASDAVSAIKNRAADCAVRAAAAGLDASAVCK